MVRGLDTLGTLILVECLILACGSTRLSPTPARGDLITVSHVVDGDTVELDDGRLVRYTGINTPERGQPFYEEARAANQRLVQGGAVGMELDVQPLDRFGRTLAYLWVGDQFVNLELVRMGYANAFAEPPNLRHSEEILAAEQEAREAQIGLWQSAGIPVKISKIHYDAPGPDPENPNGEWLELVNGGSAPVDLTGFTLKDEANHIYTFPEMLLQPGQGLRLYSGQGHNRHDTLYWGLQGDSVWSNTGDTAYLRDPEGRLVNSSTY